MKEFKLIRVSAPDGFGRGEQYGEQAAREIRMCVETYKEHLSNMKGLDWPGAREEAERYLPLATAALPMETDMLRGVARGSGVDFEDIMVLNTRYEILHYPKKECTAYAVLRNAGRDNKVFIGQNWDQRPVITPHSIILHVTLEDGMKIMGMTEAGQLLRNGMNSSGLGMVSNGLRSSRDSDDIGIPGNFMRMRGRSSATCDDTVPGVREMVWANRVMAKSFFRSRGRVMKAGRRRLIGPRMRQATVRLAMTMSKKKTAR